MDRVAWLASAYREIMARHALARDDLAREQALLDAGELAKRVLADGPAPDLLVALHQSAQAALAAAWRDAPAASPARAARERLTAGEATPLLLALMLPHELAQRAHHENRWQREHDTLHAMFDQTDQLIVVLDAEGLVEDVNPAFVHATGWSPLEAVMSSRQVWSLALVDLTAEAQADGGLHHCVQRRRDGSSFSAEWSVSQIRGLRGRRIGHVCIGRDVTRAQQVAASLRENDKLRAVATLAAGFAHDFNNLLCSINGLTELCELEAAPGSRQARNLGRIRCAGDKAAALVRQMLDFSRQTPRTMQRAFFGELLAGAEGLLRAALPPAVALAVRVLRDGPVQVDVVQMEQVLLNVVRNAAQAMDEAGGRVQIDVDHAEPTHAAAGSQADSLGVARPRHLLLRVSDTGSGIAPEVLPKIFDPFFTTKPVGEGTGLGLAAVHGIVSGHGGVIEVASQLGEGSSFSIFLPLADRLADQPVDARADPGPEAAQVGAYGAEYEPGLAAPQCSRRPA